MVRKKKHLTRTRASWKECCLKEKKDELGLVDPEVAKNNMMCKWIAKAMEPKESNLPLIGWHDLNQRRGEARGLVWNGSLTNNIKVI